MGAASLTPSPAPGRAGACPAGAPEGLSVREASPGVVSPHPATSPHPLAPPPAEPRGPPPHISDPAWDRGRFRRFFVWELGRLWRDPASQGQGCGPVAAGHIPALRTPRPAPRAGRAPGRERLCPHRPCRFPSAFPETQGQETQLPGADSFPCLHVSCPSSEPSADLGGLASACRAQLEHGVKATARCSARP